MSRFCESPDRHVRHLVCGYPLPCPYHSVIVVINTNPTKKKLKKKRRRK